MLNTMQAWSQLLKIKIKGIEPLAAKWEAFGWVVKEVNGHDVEQLCRVLKEAQSPSKGAKRPHLVIARTVKGKGVSFMEGKVEWHVGHLTQQEYEMAIEELSK